MQERCRHEEEENGAVPRQKDTDISSNDGWRTVYRERTPENATEEEKRRLKENDSFLARNRRDLQRATRRAGQAIIGHVEAEAAGAERASIGEVEAGPRRTTEQQRMTRNRAGHQRQARQKPGKREAKKAEQEQQDEEPMC